MSSPFVNSSLTEITQSNSTAFRVVVLSVAMHIFVFLIWPVTGLRAPNNTSSQPMVLSIYSAPSTSKTIKELETKPTSASVFQQKSPEIEAEKTPKSKPNNTNLTPSPSATNSNSAAENSDVSNANTSQRITNKIVKTTSPADKKITEINSKPEFEAEEKSSILATEQELKSKPQSKIETLATELPQRVSPLPANDFSRANKDESLMIPVESSLGDTTSEMKTPQGTPAEFQQAKFNGATPTIEKPKEAKRKRWQGSVVLRGRVLETGDIEQLTVFQSSGYELLDNAALEAAQHWQYLPAYNGNKATAQWVSIPITFQ